MLIRRQIRCQTKRTLLRRQSGGRIKMPESLETDSVAHANPAANQASFRCQFGGQIKDARIIRNQIRYLDANPAAGLKCQNY